MYETIWRAVKAELSGERAKEYVARLWRHARWNSFDRMHDTASEIASIMREIGLEDVEVVEYPADGVTSYGGWVMPEAWDVEDATLEIVEPEVAEPVLAHYRDCPQSLITYSAPTPPEGVVAEVVAVDSAGKEESYEGRDVEGKIVLADGVGLEIALQAFERGALGIVSDHVRLVGSPQDKGDGSLERASQWHNYTIPPWRWEKKRFGFSISPEAGRRLRELLRTRDSVKLRAVVRTRLYEGKLPLVTGLLPGRTAEEVTLTGHLCEPGANDNSSGVALGLEAVRCIGELSRAGRTPPLERGLRPVYSFEVRGYQPFLAEYLRLGRFVAGINLDMVGTDLSDARAHCNLVYNYSALPGYTDFLALELARRLEREDHLFRFRTSDGGLVDNIFGEPAVGAPMCVFGCWPDAYYHNSLDTIDIISPAALSGLGRVTATYCCFLATAGFPEAMWLARLVASHAEEEILRAVRGLAAAGSDAAVTSGRVGQLAQKNVERLRGIARLVQPRHMLPTRQELAENEDWRCGGSRFFKDVELRGYLDLQAERLREFARRAREEAEEDERRLSATGTGSGGTPGEARAGAGGPLPPTDGGGDENEKERAKRLVPLRLFKGSLCFESLDEGARRELRDRTGLTVSWGAPHWLQLAVFLSDGKRTALDIWDRLGWDGGRPPLSRLCDTIEFLDKHDFVRLRPVLHREDWLAAFREVGLPRGCVAFVHSSLTRFGYAEGGADGVIEALLEALGPDGTLAMPTFSCSFAGRPAFNPAKTPSRVGAITEAFRLRSGVLRSSHPTHSVAALGPRAEEMVRGHDPDRPVFSDEGAFGRLYELDALVLMLAPLRSNSCMHMGEERAGVPLRDAVAHVGAEGGSREVTVVHAPWHVDSFDEHYRVLFERGLVKSARLGEDKIHLMRLRDAVDVAAENLKRDPLLAAADGCDCSTCRLVRERAGGRGA